MNVSLRGLAVLAQAETQAFRTTELDLPESTTGILLLLAGLAVHTHNQCCLPFRSFPCTP